MSTRIKTSAPFLITNFNLPSFRERLGYLFSLSLFILLLLVHGVPVTAQDSLTQLKPVASNWGGLVGSIAVHPRDEDIVFIGMGRGGVYKSDNGGRNWNYVESFPTQAVSMISFSPANPSHLVATTLYDTKTSRNGGIWLSVDQGEHWSAPPGSTPPITSRCPERVTASGISWVPGSSTVWVASDCGLMRSDDLGEHWIGPILVDPVSSGGDDPRDPRSRPDRMFTVLASDGDHVVAGGESGYYYMHDGRNWHRSVGAQPNLYCPKGLAAAPRNPRQLFRADYNANYLQYSDDHGVTWQNFPAPDLIAFFGVLRTTSSPLGPDYFELYFGDGYNLKRVTLQSDVSTWSRASWQTVTLDHFDPQDIGFHPTSGRPILVAADSGVMKSVDDGATWTSLGAGNAGLNALEIEGIGVQDYPGPPPRPDLAPQPDLSFITWHNNAWNSNDGNVTWTLRGIWEGLDISTPGPALVDEADSFVILRPFGGPSKLFGRGITHLPTENNPRSSACWQSLIFYKNPFEVRPYLFAASTDCEGSSVIYDQRDIRSTRWQEVNRSNVPGGMYGLPQIAVKGMTASLYQAYTDARSRNRLLWKVRNINRYRGAAPVPSLPAMRNFGNLSASLYFNPPVFAVKPDDDQVLIASDSTSSEMKMSIDGGENWRAMAVLTRLVTDDGRLRFETTSYAGMSQATVIAFDPYNPERVVVGTMESGLLVSWNGGNDWNRLPDSRQLNHITTIAYSKTGAVYIGSAGRGVWRWDHPTAFNWLGRLDEWLCPGDCREAEVIRWLDPGWGRLLPIDLVRKRESPRIIARKGFITSFLFDQKSQQFVLSATNPDSITVYNPKHVKILLQVVASGNSDKFQNCPACTQDAKKGLGVKVLVVEPGKVLGYVPAGKDKSDIPSQIMFGTEALPDYKPSLLLEGVMKAPDYDLASQGSTVMVRGSGFAPGAGDKQTLQYVTIYLNGQRMDERVEADSKGAFEVKIKLNTIPGSGVIEAVQQTSSGRIFAERRIMINNRDGEVKMK